MQYVKPHTKEELPDIQIGDTVQVMQTHSMVEFSHFNKVFVVDGIQQFPNKPLKKMVCGFTENGEYMSILNHNLTVQESAGN